MSAKFDIYQHVTDSIITQLETAGEWTRPWVQPRGATGTGFAMPTNVTGRTYRGINVPLLWSYAAEKTYTTHIWGTFKQWKERGGSVRKGERGATVVFWKFTNLKDDKGETITDETGEAKQIPFCRGYVVFNLDQVDGITLEDLKTDIRNPADQHEDIRTARAESFIQATKADIRFGGDRAFYKGGMSDFIQVPNPEQFKPVGDASSTETYYGTVLHELTHWTGAEWRCNRVFGKRFGDQDYAFEELVAELGAAMACATLGISPSVRADHAAYIRGWLEALKNDKKAIFTAASKAQSALDYLISKQPLNWDQDVDGAEDHEDQPEPIQPKPEPKGKAKTRKPKAKPVNDDKPDPNPDGPKGGKPKPKESTDDSDGAGDWLDWLGETQEGERGEVIPPAVPVPVKPKAVKPDPVIDWTGYPSPDGDGTIHIPATFKGTKLPPRSGFPLTPRQKLTKKAGIGSGWYWQGEAQGRKIPAADSASLARKLEEHWVRIGRCPSPKSIAGAESLFSFSS